MDAKLHKAIAIDIADEIGELESRLSELKAVFNYHSRKAGDVELVDDDLVQDDEKPHYSGATEAIREFLWARPGSSAGEIISGVEGTFDTAGTPSAIVYSTLSSMERRGKITSDGAADGKRYSLAE